MHLILGQCLPAGRPARLARGVVASAKRRHRSAGSKADVYERMMESLVGVRSVVVENLHSTHRSQDWSQVMLLHEAIGEAAKMSLQLTRIEDEMKESNQTLNMFQRGGRGGVRRGGRHRMQAEENSQKAVQDAEAKLSELVKEKESVLKDTIEVIDTACYRVLQQYVTADELVSVVQLLAKEVEAAKRKYAPEKVQCIQELISGSDDSESDCYEKSEPEDEEDTRVVLSAADPSLGIEDIQSLCQVISRVPEGQELRLVTPEGANCTIRSSQQPHTPDSIAQFRHVSMRPVEIHLLKGALFTAEGLPLIRDDTSMHVAQRMFDLKTCEREARVHCVSGRDKVISEGIMRLDSNEYMVFDSTCCDVRVKNTVIHGGTIVCVGEGCSTTFSGVKFENCSLVVASGAHVTVNERTSFSCDTPQIVSIFIDGQGSSVTAEEVTIEGGRAGVVVQNGACMAANRMHVNAVECQAVVVQGAESSAELHKCEMQGLCHRGSSAVATQPNAAEIDKYQRAVLSEYLGLLQRLINYNRSVGVLSLDGGQASLADVNVKSFECGAVASNSSDLHITDSHMMDLGSVGCIVVGASLKASKLRVENFEMLGCAVLGDKASSAELSGCRVYGGWGGICAAGPQATLHMEGGIVSRGNMACVDVISGAYARLHNVVLSHSFAGVRATGKGTRVEVHGGVVKGHSNVGAGASTHAIMQLYGTRSKDNLSAGYGCHLGAELQLEECRSENDLAAVGAWHHGSYVSAIKCHIQGSKLVGVQVNEQSSVRVHNCNILKPLKDGIAAEGEGSTVEVQGGTIAKCPEVGIGLFDNAKGRISNVHVAECYNGIVGHTGAHVEIDESFVELCSNCAVSSHSASVEISMSTTCKTVSGPGYCADHSGVLSMKDCTSRADVAGCLSLHQGHIVGEKTSFSSNSKGGVKARNNGSISLIDCKVVRSGDAGVAAMGKDSHVSMRTCSISKCQMTGVEASQGAKMYLKDVTVTRTVSGPAVLSAHKGTHVLLEACNIEENSHVGWQTIGEGVVELLDTQFARNHLGDLQSDSNGRIVEASSGKTLH